MWQVAAFLQLTATYQHATSTFVKIWPDPDGFMLFYSCFKRIIFFVAWDAHNTCLISYLEESKCVTHGIPICCSMKNLTVRKLSSSLLFTLPWSLCSGAGSVCLFLAILMFYTTAFSVQVCLWCGVQTLLRDIARSYYTRLCSLRLHFIYQKM